MPPDQSGTLDGPRLDPLFLTAGGLLAREYGIPVVVGVADATERIAAGQRITVDGSAGVVTAAQ